MSKAKANAINNELLKNVERVSNIHKDREFKKRFRKTMRESAIPFYKHMRNRVPVKTGALKKSIGIRVSIKGQRGFPIGFAFVGSVRYRKGREREDAIKSMAVEFGTEKRQATPFIRPSIKNKGNQLKSFNIVGGGLRKLLKDYKF